MGAPKTGNVRNVVLVGQGGVGKTSLAEAMLHLSGKTARLGGHGGTKPTLDYDAEEVKREFSISTAIAPIDWKAARINVLDAPCYPDFIGDAYAAMSVYDAEEVKREFSISTAIAPIDWKAARINVLDAPCYPDFIGDAYAAMSVCETALFVVDAAEGPQPTTVKLWYAAEDLRLARAVFVNRVDKENADFEMCLDMLRERFGMRLGAVTLPWGTGEDFDGIIDLVRMKARHCDGTKQTESEIPEEYRAAAEAAHETLCELVAEADDDLMEKYLEGEPLTQEEVEGLLAKAIAKRLFVPVFAGSCVREQGIYWLMYDRATYFPAPTYYGEMPLIDGDTLKISSEDDRPVVFDFKTLNDAQQGRLSFLKVLTGTIEPRAHRLRRDAAHRRRHPQDLLGGRASRGLRLQDAERPAAGPSLLPLGARRHHRAGHGAGDRPHTQGRAPHASLRDVRPRDDRGGSCLRGRHHRGAQDGRRDGRHPLGEMTEVGHAYAGDIIVVPKMGAETGDTLSVTGTVEAAAFKFPNSQYRIAIEAENRSDEDKLFTFIEKACEADPTMSIDRDEETAQTIISAVGEAQVSVLLNRLEDRTKVAAHIVPRLEDRTKVAAHIVPLRIPYRETIRRVASAQGRHKKQTGGAGQFGDCYLRVEPLLDGAEYEFVDEVVGGRIPRSLIPAVDKGVQETMKDGVIAGYPLTGIRWSRYSTAPSTRSSTRSWVAASRARSSPRSTRACRRP